MGSQMKGKALKFPLMCIDRILNMKSTSELSEPLSQQIYGFVVNSIVYKHP